VRFGYFDDPGVRPIRHEDVGIWFSDRNPEDDVENFAARFLSPEDRAGLRGGDGYLELGPVRVAAIFELEIAGVRVEAHRREYQRLPSLRSIGFELPGTRMPCWVGT
jgi:hypothetical protein